MYVCNCQGVRSAEISSTVRAGATTMRALRDSLGVGTGCGKCVCEVRRQLEVELAAGECTNCGNCKRESRRAGRQGAGVARVLC